MKIFGYNDNEEEELENIMLLMGDKEPEDGDWSELAKVWIENLRNEMNKYMMKYLNTQE